MWIFGAALAGDEVVDDDEVGFGELTIQRRAFLHGGVTGEFFDESGQPEAAYREVGTTGGVGERGSDEAFADAGRAGDQQVQVLAQPA